MKNRIIIDIVKTEGEWSVGLVYYSRYRIKLSPKERKATGKHYKVYYKRLPCKEPYCFILK